MSLEDDARPRSTSQLTGRSKISERKRNDTSVIMPRSGECRSPQVTASALLWNPQGFRLPAGLPRARSRRTSFPGVRSALIHQTSRGYPRAVNNLAVQALVAAFAVDKALVDESSTRAAVAEVSPNDPTNPATLTTTAPPRRPGPVRHPADGAC